MVFNLGNLIILLVVFIILVIYRQIDRNNRSLEKVRKYATRIMQEIESDIQQKSVILRNTGIELTVHQKAAREMLHKLQSLGDKYSEDMSHVKAIGNTISEYDATLKQLVDMTARAQENLDRLHKKEGEIEKMMKRTEAVATGVHQLERSLPEIGAQCDLHNRTQLQQSVAEIMDTMSEQVAQVEQKVDTLHTHADGLKKELDSHAAQQMSIIENEADMLTQNVSSTLTQLRTEAEEHVSLSSQKIAAHFQTNDTRLEEIQERIDNIYDEGVLRIDQLNIRVEQYQEQARILDDEYEKRINELRDRIETVYAATEQKVTQLDAHTNERTEDVRAEITQEIEKYRETIAQLHVDTDAMEQEKARHIADLQTHGAQITENVKEAIAQETEKYQEKLAQLYTRIDEMAQEKEHHIADLNTHGVEITENVKEAIAQETEKYQEKVAQAQRQMENLDENRRTIMADLEEIMENYQERVRQVEQETEKRLGDIKGKGDTFEQTLLSSIHHAEQQVQTQISAEFMNRIHEKYEDMTRDATGMFDELQNRVVEFEHVIVNRVEKSELLRGDVELLEQSLRGTMDDVLSRINSDLQQHGNWLDTTCKSQSDTLEERFHTLHNNLEKNEARVMALEEGANEEMSEKMQALNSWISEQINENRAILDERLTKWQESMRDQLAMVEKQAASENEQLLAHQTEEITARMEEVYTQLQRQGKQFEQEIEETLQGITERVKDLDAMATQLHEQSVTETQSIARNMNDTIEKEVAQCHTTISTQLAQLKKQTSSSIDVQRGIIEREVTVLAENVEHANMQFKTWHDEMEKRLKETHTEAHTIHETLIETGRNQLELFQIQSNELKAHMAEYKQDFMQKGDNWLQDLARMSNEAKEKFGEIHKKSIGKIESDLRASHGKIGELEKRQHLFIEQTKVFERADALKEQLQTDIEALHTQQHNLLEHRGTVQKMEGDIGKVRHLVDESNERLKQLFAERKRIDTLERNYTQMIGLSNTVEQRLEKIISRNDSLQELQARMRTVESLEKSIEDRYMRLERKNGVIESTIEGIDKNFQELETFENRLKKIRSELNAVPDKINKIDKNFTNLADIGKNASTALQKMKTLEDMLQDIESRSKNLTTTREWIGRTETRLQAMTKEADDRVRALKMLVQDHNEDVSGDVLSDEMKDLVIKLARQGWKLDEIARQTKVSYGEIEVILGMAGNR